MKLSGNKKGGGGRHTGGGSRLFGGGGRRSTNKTEEPERAGKSKRKRKMSGGKRAVIIVFSVVLAITVLAIAAVAYLKLGAKPPKVVGAPSTPNVPIEGVDPDDPDYVAPIAVPPDSDVRTKNKYTFFVFGSDDGNGNTDVMMVATLDTTPGAYSLNVVSIPRDTLVNVSWSVKKVNSIYSAMKTPEAAITKLADILGYEVDFYVIVDLKAFEKIVDAVGGIEFDLPRNMNYDDPAQNLSIHLNKGLQTFDGKKALGVVRFRLGNGNTGYRDGDIGRIKMQQDFLRATAAQILERKNQINILTVIDVFLNNFKSNLTDPRELAWFAEELFKLDAENVSFEMMPGNYNDTVNGDSYVTIYLDEWMQIINEKLNPFDVPITLDNLSIYTRGTNGQLYVTNGHYAGRESWGRGGSSSNSSSASQSTTPDVTPIPMPTTTPDSSQDSGATTPTDTPEPIVPPDENPGTTPESPLNTPEIPTDMPEVPIATPDVPINPPDIIPEATPEPPPATPEPPVA